MTCKKNATAILAYKGFDANMRHLARQFEVGKSYEYDGAVVRGKAGFRACEHPLNALGYRSPACSRFALVEMSGEIDRETDGDTQIYASRIAIKAEVRLPELVEAAVKWVFDRAKWSDWDTVSEPNEGAIASGEPGAATASGEYGAATASSWCGAATVCGWCGAATASGESGAATASGELGAAIANGEYGAATVCGWYGAATANGRYGAATASGESGVAIANGEYGAATASSEAGVAIASHATASAHASSNGSVSGVMGAALHLDERNDDGEIIAVWAGIAGRDGIKPDTFYSLKNGKPEEAA